MSAREFEFFVGTYSEPGVENIFLYKADFERRVFTKLTSHTGSINPSYLLQSKNGLLYAVEELAVGGFVSAYRIEENGIQKLCQVSANGADPCHLELDEEEKFLFVSNYSSGSFAMFELDGEGLIKGLCDIKTHRGAGVDTIRQEAPHVHFSRYADGRLYVCDLGLDTVFCYELNREKKRLDATSGNLKLPAGNGPRHLCFSPLTGNCLYVVAELTANVFFFRLENGAFELKQTICSLPEGVPSGNRAAAIKLSEDGRILFVSNRGRDSLTAFGVSADGTLEVLDMHRTGGKAPRDFTPFGDYLVVGNQDSSQLTVLRFDRSSTRFEKWAMEESVVHPVCILRK